MGASAATVGRVRAGEHVPARLELARRVERRISNALTLAHFLGAIDVFLLLFLVLPAPEGHERTDGLATNLVAAVVYLSLATIVGRWLGPRVSPARAPWMLEGRDPNEAEREAVLRAPYHCLVLNAGLWAGGALLFTAINLVHSHDVALHVGTTILMGGVTTCAIGYLLVERIQRPVVALALESGPVRPAWPGVKGRVVVTWIAASGMPLLGLVFVAMHGIFEHAQADDLARSTLVLALLGFTLGLGVAWFVAGSLSRPLAAVRRAQARVEAGDLAAEVPVDDGSELGTLQGGFNRMVAGLRERERMQDLYSRQVGQEVAREALESGEPRLGGKVCETAVLFVDLVGSTALAASQPPDAVVARLNRFFAIVVDVVEGHGGWINKFEGDSALCVFGAPVPQADPAGCALAAGRTLAARLRAAGIEAGIGLSAGPAVAGWVGAERRFEYTVIGDPVNEASRLCDLAKGREGRLLASGAIVQRAAREEAARWQVGEEAVLRGRPTATRLAVPA